MFMSSSADRSQQQEGRKGLECLEILVWRAYIVVFACNAIVLPHDIYTLRQVTSAVLVQRAAGNARYSISVFKMPASPTRTRSPQSRC